MRKITRAWLASIAAEHWRRTYEWFDDDDGSKQAIALKLEALGESPSPDDVDSVIGNGSWTRLTCNECRKDVEEGVEVGEEPDYESHTALLCRDCAKRAVELLAKSD